MFPYMVETFQLLTTGSPYCLVHIWIIESYFSINVTKSFTDYNNAGEVFNNIHIILTSLLHSYKELAISSKMTIAVILQVTIMILTIRTNRITITSSSYNNNNHCGGSYYKYVWPIYIYMITSLLIILNKYNYCIPFRLSVYTL